VSSIAARLRSRAPLSVDAFLETIKEMEMIGELSEKYYTPEQRASLEQRARDVGEDRMRDAQTEWAELIAAVREQMQRGADPASETMS